MKISDMDARQKKAYYNIKYATEQIIGENENTISDYGEDNEFAQASKALLKNHEELVNYIYEEATHNVYEPGSCWFSKAAESTLKDIRFCGKEWLMERIEIQVKKNGY